jgi:hypothetical protein
MMAGSGRIIGMILIAAGAIIGLVSLAWLASGLADDEGGLRLSGAILGAALILGFIVIPLVGGGAFIFHRGRAEARQFEHVGRQRKMLGIVEAAGQIAISDLALQLGGTRETVRTDLYDLVSKGLFSGYVDWDRGILYARQASEMRQGGSCPNCGGNLSLAGKGLVRCQYCGAEVFLP